MPAAAAVAEIPVNIQARQLTHDDASQTVTALGDVEIEQGDYVLHADKVVYHLGHDKVAAIGNVSLLDAEGNVHFMEYAELTGDMKNGYVHGLLTMLADGSRFTADEVKREGGNIITMRDASYTPCNVCEINPQPLWQIKAEKVVHNQQEKTIDYTNARLELGGVPVAWSPVFSHADPSVKRKSGFLRPRYGYSSDVGTFVEGGYYFGDIAPNIDATLQVRPTSLQGILLMGQWRQRFETGRVELNISGVESDRTEEDGRVEENRRRGHIFANGLFNIDESWRAGFNIERASDKQYLRLYDISSENVLQSDAYAERFSGRDYSRVGVTAFQDVRLGPRPEQPEILPRLEHSMLGRPGSLLGGRWSAGFSALGLRRNGESQDVQRISTELGWERRDVFSSGVVTRTSLDGRADFYSVQDRDAAQLNPALDDTSRAVRGMVVGNVTASYPLTRRVGDETRAVIEPVVGASISPGIDPDDPRYPNEDSIDVQLDTNNLFAANRFPGIDRQEDGARVSYGVKAGLYGDNNGRYGRVYVGHSYRFDKDPTGYPQGSGVEDESSDIVGQVSVGMGRYFNADYRVQLSDDNFSVNRHELMASGGNETFDLNTGYIFLGAVEGTGFAETREQWQVGGTYRFTPNWSAHSTVLTDLGEEPGLRRASVGVGYADECFSFGLEGGRNLIREASGDSGTSVLLRIGFKNIGEFTTPRINLQGEDETGQ